MEFIDNPVLEQISGCLNRVAIGDKIISGRVEVFSSLL